MLVFTNGCFDLFHVGHVDLLKQAKELAIREDRNGRLVVGINSERRICELKGPNRPICTLAERIAVLEACRFVDEVHVFHENTPCELIQRLRPDVIIKGPGYSEANMPEAAVARECGARIVVLNGPEISTSRIIERIVERYA